MLKTPNNIITRVNDFTAFPRQLHYQNMRFDYYIPALLPLPVP